MNASANLKRAVATVTGLLTVAIVWNLLPVTTSAQGPASNPIVDAINLLHMQVQGLDRKITAVQNALSAPDSNVRFTPYVNVFASGDLATCVVLNVSSETQTIRTELIILAGSPNLETELTIPAGSGFTIGSSPCVICYCKFTVIGGSRTAIRGALQVFRC